MASLATDGKISVVLVVEGGSDYENVRSWLAKSSYVSREAIDAIDAIDELSDFTLREFPDVVLLDTRSDQEPHSAADFVRHLSKDLSHDVHIVSYSPDRARQSCLRDIDQLDGYLHAMIRSEVMRGTRVSHA